MITLQEIKIRKLARKRKWGAPLLLYVIPKLEQGYTYDAVAEWLTNEHGIIITAKQLIELKAKLKPSKTNTVPNPIPSSMTVKGSTVNETQNKIVQNKESRIVEELPFDFRRPTPEPKKLI